MLSAAAYCRQPTPATRPAAEPPRLRLKLAAYEDRCAELRYEYLEAETEAARKAIMAKLVRVMARCAAAWPGIEMGPGHYTPPRTAARPTQSASPTKRPAKRAA